MSDNAIYDIVRRLFEAKNEWAGIDIGPINGSNHVSLEQHAGFGSGTLVLRLGADANGEYDFAIEDFCTARQLAHGLLGWADVAERLYKEQNDDAPRRLPRHAGSVAGDADNPCGAIRSRTGANPAFEPQSKFLRSPAHE